MITIAERFKAFRDRAGITQKELADLVHGKSANYISEIERGTKTPGARLLREFETLEKSPAYPQVIADERMPPMSEVPPFEMPTGSGKTITAPPFSTVEEEAPPPRLFLSHQYQRQGVDPPLTHGEYAATVGWLSTLFDRHPRAFRTAMQSVKLIHDLVNPPPK